MIVKDLMARMFADAPNRRRIAKLYDELPRVWDTPRRWAVIREYYQIRNCLERGEVSPYELGLERFHTPIEFMVWQDIRSLGLPFFMQYPVGRRFVDFGDPVAQIAIEADGAQWHQDEVRAQKRTEELNRKGWRVYRIKGCDAYSIDGTNIVRRIAALYGRIYEPLEEEAA